MLFHYSGFVLLFITALSSNRRLELYKWIIPIAYVFHFFGNVVLDIDASMLGPLGQAFMGNTYNNDLLKPVNVFNSVQLMRIFFFYCMYININEIHKDPIAYVRLKVYAIGISMLPLLSFYPSISSRVHTYMCSIEILLLPSIFYIHKHKYLYKYSLYAYCMGTLLIFLLSVDNCF